MIETKLLEGQPDTWTDERGREWTVRYERDIVFLGNLDHVWALVRNDLSDVPARLYVKLAVEANEFSRVSNHNSVDDALTSLRTELDHLIFESSTKAESLVQAIEELGDEYLPQPGDAEAGGDEADGVETDGVETDGDDPGETSSDDSIL